MNARDTARVFRALHEADGCFVIPNPWDRGSAHMLQSLGFKALATTSAGHAFSQAVERVAAAVAAVRALDRDFVFTARAENFLYGVPDLDDTIARLQAFEKAGADVLYAPGIRELAQIRTVCESLSRPVNVIMGLPGVRLSVAELADAGVKRISVGSGLMRLAYSAMLEAAEKMLDPGSFDFGDRAQGFARFNELLREPD